LEKQQVTAEEQKVVVNQLRQIARDCGPTGMKAKAVDWLSSAWGQQRVTPHVVRVSGTAEIVWVRGTNVPAG
jgi:hypothetical protein